MPYNLQNDSQHFPDLDVLLRSKDQWLNYEDVHHILTLQGNFTFSVGLVEAYEQGLYLYDSNNSVFDAVTWDTIRQKRTSEDPPLYYTKACLTLLDIMEDGQETTYERKVYRLADQFDSVLVHYRTCTITDGASEDTGESEDSEESEEGNMEEDSEGNMGEDSGETGENSEMNGSSSSDSGDDHPAPPSPRCNGYMDVLDGGQKVSVCLLISPRMSKMDLNSGDEKHSVETIFSSAVDMLSDDDKKLSQVSNILPILKHCIVHLLPVLKEVIEIFFQGGLIKCLFAPATVSIRLNMPAKTVVLTNVYKFRWISSGEYIQMSGHAERRGIDRRSIRILTIDEKMEPAVSKPVLKGNANSLNRVFHLSNNMLLNHLWCEDGKPETLLRNYFFQFQADRAIPDLKKQINALEEERNSMVIEEEESYYNLVLEYKSLKKDIIVFTPKYCLPFLLPNRAVCLDGNEGEPQSFSIEDQDLWGVIMKLNEVKILSEDDDNTRPDDANYTLDVLSRCLVSRDGAGKKKIKPLPCKERGEPVVVSGPLAQIKSLSSPVMNISKGYLQLEARENALKKVFELPSRHPDEIPLDTDVDIKIWSRSSTALTFKVELKARKRGLLKLGSDNVVELKGKVACEISSAEELTLAEIMFSGVFKEAKEEALVSLLPFFVWRERLPAAAKPREELDLLLIQLQDMARRVRNAELQLDCKVEIDVGSFMHSGIMEAVYLLAKGSKFYEIMEIARVFEGSLIRAISRMEEVAAKSLGETQLEAKLEEAVSTIN